MAISVGVELGPSMVRAVVVNGAARGWLSRLPALMETRRRPPPRATAGTSASQGESSLATLLAAHEVSCDPSNTDDLSRALAQLQRALKITTPVMLGLPSSSLLLTTVAPLIPNPRRAFLAVTFELQQQVPFELLDAVWHAHWLADGHPTLERARLTALGFRQGPSTSSLQSPAAGVSRQAEAVVAVMRRPMLEEQLACCRRAGLAVKAVAANPVATLNAWRACRPSTSASSATLLNLLDERSAEWMFWTTTSLRIAPLVSASTETLWEELAASCDALRAQQELPEPVWVVGSAASWTRAQEVLTTQCGLTVQRCDVSRLLARTSIEREPRPGASVTAVGLALQGLGRAFIPLNLLAQAQRARRSGQLRRAAMLVGGLCVLATGVWGLHGAMEVRRRRVNVLEAIERREQLYQTVRPKARALLQHQQHIQQRTQQLERLAMEAPAVLRFLNQLSALLPDEVWLTKFDAAKIALPATTAAPRTDALETLLEGRAKSFQALTQFTDRLKTTAGVAAVKPLATNVTTDPTSGKEVVVFAVQAQLLVHVELAPTAPSPMPSATGATPASAPQRAGTSSPTSAPAPSRGASRAAARHVPERP